MKEQEARLRIYNIVRELREQGMGYLEIELFWLECIRKASRRTSMIKLLQLELKILRYQALLVIERLTAYVKI